MNCNLNVYIVLNSSVVLMQRSRSLRPLRFFADKQLCPHFKITSSTRSHSLKMAAVFNKKWVVMSGWHHLKYVATQHKCKKNSNPKSWPVLHHFHSGCLEALELMTKNMSKYYNLLKVTEMTGKLLWMENSIWLVVNCTFFFPSQTWHCWFSFWLQELLRDFSVKGDITVSDETFYSVSKKYILKVSFFCGMNLLFKFVLLKSSF